MFGLKKTGEKKLLEIFRTYSLQLSSILNLKDLLRNLLATLTEIADTKFGNILLYEEVIKAFVVRESYGGEPFVIQFSTQDAFINYMMRIDGPLTKHQLVENKKLIDIKESGLHFTTSVNAEAVFPLIAENKFIGILTLGGRNDGKAYSKEAMDLLGILITMASLSIDNALLCESLNKQNTKLNEIAKLKTEFVSSVTHELRTPLNGILGLTQVLLDRDSGGPLADDQKRYIQMIQSAGEDLLELVNHILDLTQFQSRRGALEVKKVDLQKTLEGVTAEIGDQLHQKRVQIRLDLGIYPHVYGDEGQIRHLFQCLMENAVKFSREDVPNTIGIKASKHGDMLKICVADQGIGIADNQQEIIFEDFRQGDGEKTRFYGGTGLGLALAKKIVEIHGGRIWVESKQGEGAQFFFTLPLKPASVSATEVESDR